MFTARYELHALYVSQNTDNLPVQQTPVFITEMECVYLAVRAQSMNITEVLNGLVMVQAVGRRSLNAGYPCSIPESMCEIYGGSS